MNRILDAAEEQFGLHGFSGTTTRSISRASGLNMSMIKYYFGSKIGLYESVIRSRIEDFNTTYSALFPKDGTPDLDTFMDHYISWFSKHRNFFRLVNLEFSSAGMGYIKEIISSAVKSNYIKMKAAIACGLSLESTDEHSPVFLYLTIFGLLQAYIENSPVYTLTAEMEGGGKLDPQKIKDYLHKLTKTVINNNCI